MSANPEDAVVDRLCELANIGAGHAAGALAQLLGRPIRMAVPKVAELGSARGSQRLFGVCFDVYGGPGGIYEVLFPERELDPLLEALLGAPEPERAEQVDSALREVGNILVSHALSAVADALDAGVVPSIPRDARGEEPASPDARLRIESDLVDEEGSLRGVLVWIPAAGSDASGERSEPQASGGGRAGLGPASTAS